MNDHDFFIIFLTFFYFYLKIDKIIQSKDLIEKKSNKSRLKNHFISQAIDISTLTFLIKSTNNLVS